MVAKAYAQLLPAVRRDLEDETVVGKKVEPASRADFR